MLNMHAFTHEPLSLSPPSILDYTDMRAQCDLRRPALRSDVIGGASAVAAAVAGKVELNKTNRRAAVLAALNPDARMELI